MTEELEEDFWCARKRLCGEDRVCTTTIEAWIK